MNLLFNRFLSLEMIVSRVVLILFLCTASYSLAKSQDTNPEIFKNNTRKNIILNDSLYVSKLNKERNNWQDTSIKVDKGIIAKFRRTVWGKDSLWPVPKRAVIASAVLPGGGQFYNKSYWKIPIVYVALGTATYFVISNQNQYTRFQKAYRLRIDNNPNTIDEFADRFSNPQQIKVYRDYYRRNRDLSIIFGMIGYSLNIIEAYVDAHLKHFDVSDDLSIKITPPSIYIDSRMGYTYGIKSGFTLQF